MIIVLKPGVSPEHAARLEGWMREQGLDTQIIHGCTQSIMGLVGDTSRLDMDTLKALDIVEDVKRVQEPYKSANRKFHRADSIIDCGGVPVGGGHFALIAGPCSVESKEQVCAIAEAVKASGANMFRGGAFKPRTSPYSFQGLRKEGIDLLLEVKKLTGLPIVTEIMDIAQLPLFADIDVIQVGARNMQNFELLRELGQANKPVLLKRSPSGTLEELLLSAEHIMAAGNEQIILCERGIRTFESYTRNTLDISAIPLLKQLSHLPVIADPSHATGIAQLVKPTALAAVAAGADGLIIEVHNNPSCALCDGPQALTPLAFAELKQSLERVRAAIADPPLA